MSQIPHSSLSLVVRLVLAGLAVVAGALSSRFGLVPIFERGLGPESALIPVLKVAGVWGMMALAYGTYVRFVERRQPAELALRPFAILAGVLSGAAIIGVPTLALFGAGSYEMIGYRGFGATLGVIAPILAVSVFEEFLFRAVLFRILEQRFGPWRSLAFVSLLFGLVHLGNEGANPVVFVSVVLISALWCCVYMRSRNVWVTGLHHAAWNTTVFVSGIPISGMLDWIEKAPLESRYEGPAWWTGGTFGPEGSVLTIAAVVVCLLALGWATRHGAHDG